MNVLKNNLTSIFFFILTELLFAQGLSIEIVVREVNRQIFDTDSQFPGFWTLTNKYHEFNYGKIRSERIIFPNDERVIREFNPKGNMVKYQVYRNDKLNDDFTYLYAEDGLKILSERGTYNLDYVHLDSNNFIGVNAFGRGKGFTYNLDTVFVHYDKYQYEILRKLKSNNNIIDRYDFRYAEDGSLLSVTISKNNIQVGHVLNKYDDHNRVTERQDFWDYYYFANGDMWTDYISNRVYKFTYDTLGFINSKTTETYYPVIRKWGIETYEIECSIQPDGDHYIAKCSSGQKTYLVWEFDRYGNWVRKEEYILSEWKVTSREITYYE